MTRTPSLLILLFLTIAVQLSKAEDIQLKDGTKITGTLLAITGEKFHIKTSYGEMDVPKSDVVSITFPENQPKSKEDATKSDVPLAVDEELKGVVYTNKTAKFNVTVPTGWELAPSLRKGSVVAALMSADKTQFFFATPEKFEGNMKTYVVLAETQFQTSFKDFNKVSETDVPIEGKAGVRIIFNAKVKDEAGTPLKFLVYIIPYQGRMVRLSFMTLEPLFDDAVPTFEKIVNSYKSLN